MGAGQSTSQRVGAHIRNNIWGIVAVFIALGDTATALHGKNTVDSGDIKKANVKRGDLAPNSVDSSKVIDNSLTGLDVDESTLTIQQPTIPSSLPPSGPAGGDLAGTYPDPQVVESGLVPGGDLTGTLANAQVSEAGLFADGDLSGALNATSIVNNSIGIPEPGFFPDDEITDGAVDAEDVNNNSLGATDLAANSVGNSELADNAAGDAEVANIVRTIPIPASEIAGAALLDPAGAPSVAGPVGIAPRLAFGAAADDAINLAVPVPSDRVPGSAMTLKVHWSGTVSGGTTVAWAVDAVSVDLTWLVTTASTTVGPLSSAPATTNTLRIVQVDLSSVPSIDNEDILFLRVYRDTDNENDDNPSNANLHMLTVEYTAER